MISNRNKIQYLLVAIFCLSFSFNNLVHASYEINIISYVTEIIDGDSFYIEGDEIRLADVNCPEYYETGGPEATQRLTGMIEGKKVYLDTDQLSGRDKYNRQIAVVYIDYNKTHLVNINLAMVVMGNGELIDYTNNEFDPEEWNYFEAKSRNEGSFDIVDTELLGDYYSLADDYDDLIIENSELVHDYNALIEEYNGLVDDYNALIEDYGDLEEEHNELVTQYSELEISYEELEQEVANQGIPGFPVVTIILGAFLAMSLNSRVIKY